MRIFWAHVWRPHHSESRRARAAPPPVYVPLRFAADWRGRLAGRRRRRPELFISTPQQKSTLGGSGSFLCLGEDGSHYWVKALNGPQGDRVPATEQIVGAAGALIGAPCCGVSVVYLPKAIRGWEFRPGFRIVPGCAHGSLAVNDCVEEKPGLGYRAQDDNARRHAGYYALYDWCWGDDPQGLLVLTNDRQFHSHDHGHFLPPAGRWDVGGLEQRVAEAREVVVDGAGIDLFEVSRIATRLEAVTREELTNVVARVPKSWPVADDELEAVGAFLEERAPMVAARLRARFGVNA